MKLTYFYSIAFFLIAFQTFAQQATQTLKVGDKMPDIMLGKLINSSKQEAKLSDYKGKLLILDFWATWCSPCVAFLSTAESLKAKFPNNLEILPVTYENETIASQFLTRMVKAKNMAPIASIVEDTTLRKLFPHKLIPHEIWIDSDGTIRAITGSEIVTESNIEKVIKDQKFTCDTKSDKMKHVKFGDPTMTSVSSELKYSSILTGYKQDYSPGLGVSTNYITMMNVSISYLYRWALGNGDPGFIPNNRTVFELLDTSRVLYTGKLKNDKWVTKNWYCYEFSTADTTIAKNKSKFAVTDLNKFFGEEGINGKLEKRKVMCWALINLSKVNKAKTAGGTIVYEVDQYHFKIANKKIGQLIDALQTKYQQFSPFPFIDQTGISENVDLNLECSVTNIDAINKELKKYDLQFVKKELEIDMVVISQKPVSKSLRFNNKI